jgi:hypothetical protein
MCSENIWIGTTGGSVRSRNSETSTTCGGDGDCFQGSKCIQTGPIRQCFFDNPKPADGDYKVAPGQSKSLSVPVIDNGLNIIWSGVMTGRRNCTNGVCDVADCGNENGGCKPSQGFQQPATQAEMTLLKDGVDFYDVEIINGVSLPISFGPVNAGTKSDDAYFCGNPGSKHPRTPLGACNWNF